MGGGALSPVDVLELSRVNTLVVADDSTILAAYGGRGRLAGWSNAELVGRSALDFLAPTSHAVLADVFAPDEPVVIVTRPTSFPVDIVRADGDVERHELVPAGFEHGSIRGWVVSLTSRFELTHAGDVMRAVSQGETMSTIARTLVDRLTHTERDTTGRAVAVIGLDTHRPEVIVGRPGPIGDAIGALVRDGSDALWDLIDVDAPTVFDLDRTPAAFRDAVAAEGLVQAVGMRIESGSGPALVLIHAVLEPNAPRMLGNVRLAFHDLQVALCRAIEREEGQRSLERAAAHDPLTGLLNRAGFEQRASAAEAGSSVIYVDLDSFKVVNDTYGHAAGDAVLAEVAERLRHACRPHDRIARLGGDEFAVIVGTDLFGARTVAQRLLDAVSAPLPSGIGPERITASVGVATVAEGDALDAAVIAADHAMLAAKRSGKARIDTA